MGPESQAADVGLPRAYDANIGGTGVYIEATSGSAQRYVIPASWKQRIIEFSARDFEMQIVFGDSTVVAALDATATNTGTTTKSMVPAATAAWPIYAGNEKPFRFQLNDDAITHFSVIAKGAGMFFARVAQNAG